jgi:hypothetical protein
MQVKAGKFLHWPEDLIDDRNRLRLGAGGVIDLDAPLEVEWCAGQEYKLESAPRGARADSIRNQRALNAIRAHGAGLSPKRERVEIGHPEIPEPVEPKRGG